MYLVGGAVRDTLLGLPVYEKDWLVVGATPKYMLDLGYRAVGKDFPVFLHPQTNEEYALARTERKTGVGYKGFTFYSDTNITVEEDLQRRDLTINAMAQVLNDKGESTLIDPYGGKKDLNNRILRHVSNAFIEDPLRVLRVARFAAKFAHLGFTVAPETMVLIQQLVAKGEIQSLVVERVWQETQKALLSISPVVYFDTLWQCGALPILMPELVSSEQDYLQLRPFFTEPQIDQKRANQERAVSGVEAFSVLLGHRFIRDNNAIKAFVEYYRLPQHLAQNAHMIAKYYNDHHWLNEQVRDSITTARLAAEPQINIFSNNLLTLLNHLDVWRRPEKLSVFLKLCQKLDQVLNNCTEMQWPDLLVEAYDVCQNVDVQVIIQEGYQHKEIAEQLKLKRLALIFQLLKLRY